MAPGRVGDCPQPTVLTSLPASMIGHLVPGHSHQPRGGHPDGVFAADRVDRGKEGLPGQSGATVTWPHRDSR